MGRKAFGLRRFIEEKRRLHILATDTALEDIEKTLRDWQLTYPFTFSRAWGFNTKWKLLHKLRNTDLDDFDGLLIARGGGDRDELSHFDDPEILDFLKSLREQENKSVYLAVGHANTWLNARRHVDQWFRTPSTFGEALVRALRKEKMPEDVQGEYEFIHTRPVEKECPPNAPFPSDNHEVRPTSQPIPDNSGLVWGGKLLFGVVAGFLAIWFCNPSRFSSPTPPAPSTSSTRPERQGSFPLAPVSNEPPVYWPGHFPDGHVYAIPDLTHLAGQPLHDAWLRGTFLVIQATGQPLTYHLRTYQRAIPLPILNGFQGIGSTHVILRYLQRPFYEPVGKIITFSKTEPLRLNKVIRGEDGSLWVQAICCQRYR